MINTIISDLGGVYFTDGTDIAIEILSSKYNIPKKKIKKVLKGRLGMKYRENKITREEFWKKAEKKLNKKRFIS